MSPALGVTERVARTERIIAYIRAGVVAFNVATYLTLAPTSSRHDLALVVCAGAVFYTIGMLYWRPAADSQTMLAATTGTVVDTLLIGVWIFATGGFASPYFPVLYAEAAATVGRFGPVKGALSGVGSAIVYYLASAIDGSVAAYPMSVRIAYIFVIVAFVGYVVDVAARSERHTSAAEAEAEGLRELDRLRSSFVTHISHELRTPLTAIRGAAVTLNSKADGLAAGESDVLVGMIDRQSARLARLIEDIIDVGLVEHGKLVARVATADAIQIARQVAEDVSASTGHPIVVETGDVDRSYRIVCDEGKIANAIRKVVENAIKFSPAEEPVRITVEDGAGDVRILVRDKGIGVAPEYHSRIFESFYQVDPTHTQATPGTGIGLSVARAILKLHGGDIEVSSAVGQGSVFTLRIPREGRGRTRIEGDDPAEDSPQPV